MSENTHSASSNSTRNIWHAIVIGTDEYPEMSDARLKGCVRDATAMYSFFREKLGLPEERIRFLTSPATNPANLSTGANIRAAFAALLNENTTLPGDHVLLFYACHGVRLARANAGTSDVTYYGMVTADASTSPGGYQNMVLDREINRFLRRLQKRGVSITVIADTCHSGASTRSLGRADNERYLKNVEPLSQEAWAQLQATHPAFASAPAGTEAADKEPVEDKLLGKGTSADADFVVLAACQDIEKAKEVTFASWDANGASIQTTHGALTGTLLEVLEKVPAGHINTLRWMDFYDELSTAVSKRVAAQNSDKQRPALEGNPARTVFGGQWQAFSPGFTLRTAGNQILVDGGTLHGLDVGAELDVYPYDTQDFEKSTVAPVAATITSATFATSVAQLKDPAAKIEAKSRGKLIKPSPNDKPILVRLVDVPSEIVKEANLDAADVLPYLRVVGANEAAHLEVRPFQGAVPHVNWTEKNGEDTDVGGLWRDARDGWILVPSDDKGSPSFSASSNPLDPDDIIAYLPGSAKQLTAYKADERQTKFANALRNGLLHHASYLRTRDRSGGDESARAMLSVKLRVISEDLGDRDNEGTEIGTDLIDKSRYVEPENGTYRVKNGENIFLEVSVIKATTFRLFVGLVLCSEDGSVAGLWPPEGQNYTFDAGRTTYIGRDRFDPLYLACHNNQQWGRIRLKLVTYTAPHDAAPINIKSFELEKTTQEVVIGMLLPTRGLPERPKKKPEVPAAYTWDFDVVYAKS